MVVKFEFHIQLQRLSNHPLIHHLHHLHLHLTIMHLDNPPKILITIVFDFPWPWDDVGLVTKIRLF